MTKCLYFVIIFFFLKCPAFHTKQTYKQLTVATYNLWNVMFTWDARKYFIVQMIKQADPDVIGFQEVRADQSGPRNQLSELQTLLSPLYKYASYHPITTVDHGPPGWEQEGLGILSKHPILLSHVIDLKSKQNNPDKNKRLMVHVQVDVHGNEIDFTLVHLSYDRQQQCQNAVDVINYIASVGSERSVIFGDFNAYEDFSWPVQAILKGSFDSASACKPDSFFDSQDSSRGYGYVDAWKTSDGKGYTFSNMPQPGLINRPDRILVSTTGLTVLNTIVLSGSHYKESYYYSLLNIWYRLNTVMSFANESLEGTGITHTCHQDCGPHGSCRCGVCVQGGDGNNCDLQFCYECSPAHYNAFLVLTLFVIVYCVLIVYIILKVILRFISSRGRRYNKRLLILLSNKSLFILLIFIVFIIYLITILNFTDTLDTVIGRIPEEMHPSDHRMVVTKIRITYR